MDSDTPFTWYNRLYLNWQPAVLCKQTSNRWQPCWTNSHCLFNRLSHWVVQPVWQLAVYTIQPFVKQVVKTNRLVDCLYTWYNWLSKQFDNRLYRVNGAWNRRPFWIFTFTACCSKTVCHAVPFSSAVGSWMNSCCDWWQMCSFHSLLVTYLCLLLSHMFAMTQKKFLTKPNTITDLFVIFGTITA